MSRTGQARLGSRMNRKAVIMWMTAAVFIVLGALMLMFFEGWPPWPVTFWFIMSHVFFCVVVARVKPFTGPYTEPMAEPELPHLEYTRETGPWRRQARKTTKRIRRPPRTTPAPSTASRSCATSSRKPWTIV